MKVDRMSENVGRWLRDEIENAILSNEFEPGARLDETVLANRFGVSRTPVREALMQLDAIGLVEIRPRRGAVVIDPGPHRIYEMFEVMAELEGMCGRLAARRIGAEELTALREAHNRCEAAAEAGDADDYYYENEAFHDCIYRASHNGFLAGEARQLKQRLKPYRRLQLQVRQRIGSSLEEHSEIVAAIEAGDAARAEQAMRDHVLIQGERFSDFVSSVRRFGVNQPASA